MSTLLLRWRRQAPAARAEWQAGLWRNPGAGPAGGAPAVWSTPRTHSPQPRAALRFWNMPCTLTPPCFHVSWAPWDTRLRSACVQKGPGVREAGPVEGGRPEMQSHWDTAGPTGHSGAGVALRSCAQLRQGGRAFAPSFHWAWGLTLSNWGSHPHPPVPAPGQREGLGTATRASPPLVSSLSVPLLPQSPSHPCWPVLLPAFPSLGVTRNPSRAGQPYTPRWPRTFTWCLQVAGRK